MGEPETNSTCEKRKIIRGCLSFIIVLLVFQLLYSTALYENATNFAKVFRNDLPIDIFTPPSPRNIDNKDMCNNSQNSGNNTSPCKNSSSIIAKSTELPLCPETPPKLVGPLATYRDSPSYEILEKMFPEVEPGGRYRPPDCKSRHKMALILPYRNRDLQLRTFLKNMHPILERQQLDYGIYVIEQAEGTTFNRALLMNIGYAEAMKLYDWQCFAFHDVDLIPEDDRIIYNCPNKPRHLTAAIDKFGYRLPYGSIFGGAVMLTREQFENVNGFSNKFFGWGGEDDDMWNRVHKKGYVVIRYPMNIARYRMIKHGPDKGNEANPARMTLINKGPQRYSTDGLNSLKYKVLKREFHKLYTLISVSVDQQAIMKS